MAWLPDSGHLVEAFLDMMSAERGAGANTLAAYRRDLLDFAGHADPAKASRDEVRGFLTGLSSSGMAEQGLHAAQVRAALHQMGGEGMAQHMRRHFIGVHAGLERQPLEQLVKAPAG